MKDKNLFRTTFEIPPSKHRLGYADKVLWTGSCFTENLGLWLQKHGVDSMVNPFGILYNPFSISASLKKIIENYCYKDSELEEANGRYVSFDHHGRYSGIEKNAVLDNINNSIEETHNMLKEAKWLFITFGSAWAFKRKSTGKIVANCHKVPATEFERVLLPLEGMVDEWKQILTELKTFNPLLKVVFTVSPVRHWRDGAVPNQRSKAMLHTLVHELTDSYANCGYFPAYELMMDDLRDYRFYAADMIHPSDVAVEYIRERFLETYFEVSDMDTFKKMKQLVKAVEHRIVSADNKSAKRFLHTQLELIEDLKSSSPAPNLSYHEIDLKWKLSKLG